MVVYCTPHVGADARFGDTAVCGLPRIVTTSFSAEVPGAATYTAVQADTAMLNNENVVKVVGGVVKGEGRPAVVVCACADGMTVSALNRALTAEHVATISVQYHVDGPVNRFRSASSPAAFVMPISMTKGFVVKPGTDVVLVSHFFTEVAFREAMAILPGGVEASCSFTACYQELHGRVPTEMRVACANPRSFPAIYDDDDEDDGEPGELRDLPPMPALPPHLLHYSAPSPSLLPPVTAR